MGAAPCLEHVYGELKAFAKESNLNLHLNQLTRKIISWGSHADYPSGFRSSMDCCFDKTC